MINVTKEQVIYLQCLFTVLKEEKKYFPQLNMVIGSFLKQSPGTHTVSVTGLTFISQWEKVYDSSVNMFGSPC